RSEAAASAPQPTHRDDHAVRPRATGSVLSAPSAVVSAPTSASSEPPEWPSSLPHADRKPPHALATRPLARAKGRPVWDQYAPLVRAARIAPWTRGSITWTSGELSPSNARTKG